MVTISHFNGLTRTTAEPLEIDIERWLDLLATEPADQYAGQMEHPGWSPVLYDPPRRELANVRRVFALVLDHDKGAEIDRLVELWTGSSGVVYTTKSHADGAPRYRVVLALARPVTAEEYAKVWDWGAARSQAAQCPADKQCKDASRFWYSPTLPPGGWRAERLTGKAVDPDAIIALAASAQPQLRVVRPRQQSTPSDRVSRARAYLRKIPGAVSGQSGHTATFNATAHVMIGFDLSADDALRLIQDEYNPRCSPEWSERELEHKIHSVAAQCKRERGYLLNERPKIVSTQHAAAYAPEAPAELDVDWTTQLLYKADRSARRAYYNTAVFVRHHPEFRGKWSLDLMTHQPWFDGRPMEPSHVHYIRAQADCRLGYTPPAADVEAAIVAAAADRPFHPILQYLRSLDWDGVPRLSAMARDYLGSDRPLHAEMVRKFMVGAAARALWPGCKLDTALMLVGDQGLGKSTFFAVLGGCWHADTFIDITNKDAAIQLHASWIYELAELENVVTGARESRLKAWLTSTHDLYRPPYGRTAERRARAVSICGTTNRRQFLTDDTGSRRFHIVPVERTVPRDLLAEMRDQLWAEAVCAAESGELWWFGARQEREREVANEEFHEDDVWLTPIADYLAVPGRDEASMTDVLAIALKLDVSKQDRSAQMRAARILKSIGWRKERESTGSRHWIYRRQDVNT